MKKMNISAFIIDSDVLAKTKIKELIHQHSIIEILGDSSNAEDAIEKINTLNPDVVFLDVEINKVSGFEIIENISLLKKPMFIFVTKRHEYAIKAFDYFAFDYILKPYKKERFFASLNKIIEFKRREELANFQDNLDNILDLVKEKNVVPHTSNNKRINIKTGNKIIFLDTNSIKYISASGYYLEIFTIDNKKYLLRESLSSIINRLNSTDFIRIHRSTIINSNYVDEVITSNYGETDVKTNDNKIFRVSKGYKKEFQELMGVK